MRTPQSELERRRLNERGRQILQRKAGTAVRPMREDGYVNLLNKYGTTHDNSESYGFEREPLIPDMQLTSLYEGNGLFTKIIDAPAEEALKHGFDLNLKNDELDAFVEEALDDLEWEEKAATAIKWARLGRAGRLEECSQYRRAEGLRTGHCAAGLHQPIYAGLRWEGRG